MPQFGVASPPQHVVAFVRHRLMAVAIALVAACTCACGPSSGPTSPSERTPAPAPSTSPPQSAYTVKGLVRNGRGAVVAGAEVWIYGNSSPIESRYGTAWTDTTGRYSVSSPERAPHAVRVLKDGHIPRDVSISGLPDATSSWTVDVVLVHIDRYSLLPLSNLRAGQFLRLEARVELDDGSSDQGLLFMHLSSSNPSVLDVGPTGWVQGVSAGTATVTATYYGAVATLPIRVE